MSRDLQRAIVWTLYILAVALIVTLVCGTLFILGCGTQFVVGGSP